MGAAIPPRALHCGHSGLPGRGSSRSRAAAARENQESSNEN